MSFLGVCFSSPDILPSHRRSSWIILVLTIVCDDACALSADSRLPADKLCLLSTTYLCVAANSLLLCQVTTVL